MHKPSLLRKLTAALRSALRPLGERIRQVSIRKIGTVIAAIGTITILVTGCEYATQPNATEMATASPSASASSASVTTSLNGSTEVNQFFLPVKYTCVEGDTWETVASEFGLKQEILKGFNRSVTLQAGASLDLRGRDTPQLGAGGSYSSSPDGAVSYVIDKNDTLLGITSRFGVPAYALRISNPTLRGNGHELLLPPGRNLLIPSAL